jgi:hypothetical protein
MRTMPPRALKHVALATAVVLALCMELAGVHAQTATATRTGSPSRSLTPSVSGG